MSTSPDELITLLSEWLARHVDDDALRRGIADVERERLSPDERETLEELRADVEADGGRAELERAVREALEAFALGR